VRLRTTCNRPTCVVTSAIYPLTVQWDCCWWQNERINFAISLDKRVINRIWCVRSATVHDHGNLKWVCLCLAGLWMLTVCEAMMEWCNLKPSGNLISVLHCYSPSVFTDVYSLLQHENSSFFCTLWLGYSDTFFCLSYFKFLCNVCTPCGNQKSRPSRYLLCNVNLDSYAETLNHLAPEFYI
jgi:hypothetical protein